MHNSNRLEPWREISSKLASDFEKGDKIYANNHYVAFRELQYYLNVISNKGLKIDFVKDGLTGEKIYLVLTIYDEEEREKINQAFKKAGYVLKSKNIYVPYAETVASKLPTKHHKLDQGRVEVYLYLKRRG